MVSWIDFFVQKNEPNNVDGHAYEMIYSQEINFNDLFEITFVTFILNQNIHK